MPLRCLRYCLALALPRCCCPRSASQPSTAPKLMAQLLSGNRQAGKFSFAIQRRIVQRVRPNSAPILSRPTTTYDPAAFGVVCMSSEHGCCRGRYSAWLSEVQSRVPNLAIIRATASHRSGDVALANDQNGEHGCQNCLDIQHPGDRLHELGLLLCEQNRWR